MDKLKQLESFVSVAARVIYEVEKACAGLAVAENQR